MATHSSILAMDRGAWWAIVHGFTESDTTKPLTLYCRNLDYLQIPEKLFLSTSYNFDWMNQIGNMPRQLSKTFGCQKVRDKPHKDSYHIDEAIDLSRNCWDIFPKESTDCCILYPTTKREGHHLIWPQQESNSTGLEGPGARSCCP